ncbi:protein EDS1B-like [Cryptomeria japonica]|uniref:protein EDS1B-like n=1 Tax=Cryptomeria japonica TaxID=3369 RepID=UPI0025AC7255|nr:protein EDS1B-like [Cryptomeria japonica]
MEVRDGKYDECNIQNADTVSSPSLKGDDDQPALVHKGAFNRFQYILENTDLDTQVQALREQAIIFGGHSIGGAVATLATLFFLGKGLRNTPPSCITFGSPLVGDARLGQAIARQDWSGKFCHVVSVAEPLNTIVPHWGPGSDLPIQEASRTLVNNGLQYTGSPSILYRPSGTYMFCSMNRAACFDDSEAILKILHCTLQSNQGLSFDQIVDACISEHTGYGKLLKDITENLQNSWQIANFVPDSFEMGIALALEAIGVGAQKSQRDEKRARHQH